MAEEDFTTFTEVDIPANRIQNILAGSCDMVGVDLDETVYLYKDYGVDHFDGNFEHLVDTHVTAHIGNGQAWAWGVSNTIGQVGAWGAGSLGLQLRHLNASNDYTWTIQEWGGTWDRYIAPDNNPRWIYLTIERDEGAGTLTATLYSDAARTVWVDTLTIVLVGAINARYAYALASNNAGVAGRSFTCENEGLDLQEGLVPGSGALSSGFEVRRSATGNLKAGFTAMHWRGLPADFVVRHPGTADLKSGFESLQGSESLKAGFVVVQLPSLDLLGEFFVRNLGSSDLKSGFTVMHSRELPADFMVRQPGTLDLGGGFISRQVGASDLKAGFTAQWIHDLKAGFSARYSASTDVASRFAVNQYNGIPRRLKAGFNIRACFDFSSSLGISFYWWGSGHDVDVDLVLKTPTGDLVAAFGDGPAEWRWIFLSWDDFREVGIDGSRPNKASVCCILWTVHTSGTWRVDHVAMWRSFELKGAFIVRHATAQNLKTGFTVRHAGILEMPAEMIVRHAGSLQLRCGFTARHSATRDQRGSFAVGQDRRDLKASFTIRQKIDDLSCGFVVRHPGSGNLKSFFEIQAIRSLPAGFTVRQAGSADLGAGIRLRQEIFNMSAEIFIGEDFLVYTEVDG